MSQADDVFVKNFLIVLGGLVLIAVLAFVLAQVVGFGSEEKVLGDAKAVAERIAPVGQVRVSEPGSGPAPMIAKHGAVEGQAGTVAATPTSAAAPAPAAPAVSTEKTGEEIYTSVCSACHSTGAAGAPKLDDKANWSTRFEQGLAALVTSAVQGKKAMPAKGGNPALSDDDIKKAVEYMLAEAGLATGSDASTTSPAPTASASPVETPGAPSLETGSAPPSAGKTAE